MNQVKEELYKRAIKNLLKSVRYHQQLELLLTDQITEEEYDEELENNSDKYVIDCTSKASDKQILIIGEILKEIDEFNENFGVDDIEEIFGFSLSGSKDAKK